MPDKALSLNEILGEDGVSNTFNGFMSLWVLPEIDRRRKDGRIAGDFALNRAQVIFDQEKSHVTVRLNDEIRALAIAKINPGVKKTDKETVYEHEISEILGIRLTDQDSPNAAHATMIRFKDKWLIHFDFRQNKAKAQERYSAAVQFLTSAKQNLEQKLDRPFMDNLFSAVELFATSQLLCMSESKYAKKQSHPSTNMKYNSYIKIGNAKPEFAEVLNKLWGVSDPARYCNGAYKFDWADASRYLEVAQEMMDYTKKYIY